MPIWDYNDKFYLRINEIKIKELPGEIELTKDNPYIADLTFSKYDFQKNGGGKLQVIVFLKLIKFIKLLYI